ncbi:copper resistance CopC family protein [Nonomuraea candida]|uniref:copper resistance CopC family protein n=1 Tax=Nonomuraea candida TaxID=359159 RepID=UPI0007C7A03C|nr:copper resistance CopC family protein [Nonomuraea candida]
MRRLLTVLLLALAAVGVLHSPAQAHNVLIGSDPQDGATLTASPAQVTLVFDQAVRQGYAQVGVTGADGSAWADGSAVVAAERVSVKVKPLPAGGSYTVGYRILSADGHPVTGKISFSLAASASGVAAADAAQGAGAEAAEAAANGGAGMAVVWIVAALLVLGAGTAVALRRAAPARTAGAAGTGAAGTGAAGTGAAGTAGTGAAGTGAAGGTVPEAVSGGASGSASEAAGEGSRS